MPSDNGPDAPSVSLRQRVLSPYTLLSLAVAVAFLYFLAVRFDLDWEQTWSNIKALDPLLYALGLILYYLSFGFRGLRWRILSRSAGIEEFQMLGHPRYGGILNSSSSGGSSTRWRG